MASEKFDFELLKKNWKSPICSRERVAEFSGGVLAPRTLANLDSLGRGPKCRLKIGRKVVYTIDSLIEFLRDRSA